MLCPHCLFVCGVFVTHYKDKINKVMWAFAGDALTDVYLEQAALVVDHRQGVEIGEAYGDQSMPVNPVVATTISKCHSQCKSMVPIFVGFVFFPPASTIKIGLLCRPKRRGFQHRNLRIATCAHFFLTGHSLTGAALSQ